MPLYDYECTRGHVSERIYGVSQRPATVVCDCGSEATQVILDAPALHTCGTFSRDIADPAVQRTRDPGDGSYFDPNLFDRKTGKHPRITSAKQREQVMKQLGVQEIAPSDKAKDVARERARKPKSFTNVGLRS